ncbi:MAG: glycosyltransferase [Candidatus Moranbacteria bacterium]|nr:glycosyltransferase [Candidatus Moranbacteria bacterium]
MKKKILFITNSFPAPEYKRLWKKATSLASEDYQVFVISPQGKQLKKEIKHKNIQTFFYKKRKRKENAKSFIIGEISDFLQVRKLAFELYYKEKFDVVHITNPTDTLAIMGIIFKLFKCIFVYENNENYPSKYKSLKHRFTFWDKVIIRFLEIIEKKVIKKADLIIVPQSKQRIRISRLVPQKRNRIITIEPLPDLKDFYHPFLDHDYKMGFKHMIVYAGSLRIKRGLGKLLNVINFIVNDQRKKDILFVLAGEGKDKTRIKKYLKNKNLISSVYLPGWLDQEKLLSYLTAADLGVLVESRSDSNCSFRDSLFEFMACGKPVISFNYKPNNCRVGEAGTFLEGTNELLLAKEIIRILDNKEKIEQMGRIGQLKVEKQFNWLKSEIKLLSAYNKLFTKKA